MTFSGFPDAGPAFYEGLEADNSKTYWLAHKAVYESAIREPMLALVDALEGEFGEARLFRTRPIREPSRARTRHSGITSRCRPMAWRWVGDSGRRRLP